MSRQSIGIIIVLIVVFSITGVGYYFLSSVEAPKTSETELPIYPEASESKYDLENLSYFIAGPLAEPKNRINALQMTLGLPTSEENLLQKGWREKAYKTGDSLWNLQDWYKEKMGEWAPRKENELENLLRAELLGWKFLDYKEENKRAIILLGFRKQYTLIILVASPDVHITSTESPKEPELEEPYSLHDSICIKGNKDFTQSNGVLKGDGTETNPYVLNEWGFANWDNYAMRIENTTAHFTIRNCLIENGGIGITMDNVVNGKVENCIIKNNRVGIKLSGGSDNNTLKGNVFKKNHLASLYITENVSNNTFSHNIVKNNGRGIWTSYMFQLLKVNKNTIAHNLFENNETGIGLYSADNNVISHNILKRNQKGILISYSSGNLLTYNTFENNQTGLLVKESDFKSGENNWAFHNNFIKNKYAPVIPTSKLKLDNGYPSGGNYWSDYDGQDEYAGENQDIPGSDGIGDTPHQVFGKELSYPLMEPVETKIEIYE